MRRQLASYQMRVDASQAMGLAALGFGEYADKVFDSSTQANSSMGGITIHGDTHQYLYGQVPQQPTPQPTAQPQAQPADSGLSKWLAPALLGAALTGGGAGSYALWDYFNNSPAPVVQQNPADSDWKLGVEVRDR
jgi:hypothetical protein